MLRDPGEISMRWTKSREMHEEMHDHRFDHVAMAKDRNIALAEFVPQAEQGADGARLYRHHGLAAGDGRSAAETVESPPSRVVMKLMERDHRPVAEIDIDELLLDARGHPAPGGQRRRHLLRTLERCRDDGREGAMAECCRDRLRLGPAACIERNARCPGRRLVADEIMVAMADEVEDRVRHPCL